MKGNEKPRNRIRMIHPRRLLSHSRLPIRTVSRRNRYSSDLSALYGGELVDVSYPYSSQAHQSISLHNYTPLAEGKVARIQQSMKASWSQLSAIGRVYIAHEGINAQLILPASNVDAFAQSFPQLFNRQHLNFGADYETTPQANGYTNTNTNSTIRSANSQLHALKWAPDSPNAVTRARRLSRAYCTTSTGDRPPPYDLNAYVHEMSSSLSDDQLLRELRAATEHAWPKSEQLIDEPQGKALSFLVQLTGAKDVLEIGCFTGYSALCLASGLASDDGSVTTCDINADTSDFARSFFDRSPNGKRIHTVVCDGLEFLEGCAKEGRSFDFVFVDANKRQYVNYYEAILAQRLLNENGLLVFDNTLFRGRVLAFANGEASKKERIAQGLAAFNDHISNDPRTVCLLLPVWDGLTVVRWRK